jgi:hypothetical protein
LYIIRNVLDIRANCLTFDLIDFTLMQALASQLL